MQRAAFLERMETLFRSHPTVGILGPRQCGKTTLARDYRDQFGRPCGPTRLLKRAPDQGVVAGTQGQTSAARND